MSKTVHIAFDDLGLSDQWVELRDPRFLSKRTIDRWQRAQADGSLDETAFLREFVSSWHILDADTGDALNDPASDSIDGLPIVVFQVLNLRVAELFRGSLAAPESNRADRGVADGDTRSAAAAA